MPSYIAAFALQQLQEMEQLQRDFGRRKIRRRRRAEAQEAPAPARVPVPESAVSPARQPQTRRAPGVSPSTKRA